MIVFLYVMLILYALNIFLVVITLGTDNFAEGYPRKRKSLTRGADLSILLVYIALAVWILSLLNII